MVKPIDVPNCDDRDDDADKAERTESQPMVKPRIEPRDKDSDSACTDVIRQDAPCIEVPHFTERTASRQDDRCIDRRGVDEEIQESEDKEDA